MRLNILIEVHFIYNQKLDPRYRDEKTNQQFHETLSNLSKSTHEFIRAQNSLARHSDYLEYNNFLEQRKKYRKQ